MNTKTMEGLVGARTNINMINTPLRVFKEARRKGDTATMQRAMGYAAEFEDKAERYKTQADEGMKEDTKEAREKAGLERGKAIEKRKEEREKLGESIEESRDVREDKVEISEEGKVLLEENANLNSAISTEKKTAVDIVKEPVTYTKTGEVSQTEKSLSILISV